MRTLSAGGVCGWLCIASAGAAAQQAVLRHVTLTQAGVATFDYAATVSGAAAISLDLPRADVSDALRSLVVRDGAGTVVDIAVPGADPAAGALARLPVPAAALGNPIRLLGALRGTTVAVAGARPMSGVIVAAQGWLPAASGARAGQPASRITLLTDSGLQSFALDDVASVQIADAGLRARLLGALHATSGVAAAADRRRLVVRVDGPGTRAVELSVVLPVPLWKATYRLAQPGPAEARARLQAWAVVENAGIEDWHEVGVTLQTGTPVAFQQDVYATVRAARPVVPADLLAHPAPRLDEGGLPVAAATAPATLATRMMLAPEAATTPPVAPPREAATAGGEPLAASYALPRPLTLPVGEVAALPFLDSTLPARRVWSLASEARHPLAGIELVNDTGSSLPPGSVTTLAADGFAGDALLGVFPAGARRVLTYAEDPTVGAAWDHASGSTLVGLSAAHGILRITRRERQSTTVTLAATDQGGHVLLDIPYVPGTTLSTQPAGLPVERAAAVWRIAAELPDRGTLRVVADADRVSEQSIGVSDDPSIVAALIGDPSLAASAREGLQRIADLRATADARERALQLLQEDRAALLQDEQRTRENLAAVAPTDTLRGRLLQALEAAEDALGRLDSRLMVARRDAQAAQTALADAVAALAI